MRLFVLIAVLLFAGNAAANEVKTEFGTLADAEYRIDFPAQWNRELIVHFHGYAISLEGFRDDRPDPAHQALLARGYAVVQSNYSRAGWAIEQATADSERLRRHFVSRHGKPKRTYAMGYSMGGLLTVHAVETQPTVYAGGLALCGAIAPTDTMMQRAFAARAAFDFHFPEILGPLDPVPENYLPDRKLAERVADALRANPAGGAALRTLLPGTTEDSFPGVITFVTYVIKEMQQRAGANPFDNSEHVYVGTADDVALNAGVARYRGDANAARYLQRWYSPTGKLERPLLALHTSGDALVPASLAFEYALLTRKADRAQHFVQQYVPLEGHCTMTPEQIVGAFDDLIAWVDGERPVSGLRP